MTNRLAVLPSGVIAARSIGCHKLPPAVWNSLTIIPPHFRVRPLHSGPGTQVSNRDRDFRPTRRRGFDDDNFESPRHSLGSPSSAQRFEAPSGLPVQAVVKWYNPDKGFGFVQLADGSGDAFLHVSVVERSGHDSVPPGATLEVRAGPGPKGPQVSEILSVDSSTAQQEPPRRPRPERPVYPPADGTAVEESGTVKWYNATKGFGFIKARLLEEEERLERIAANDYRAFLCGPSASLSGQRARRGQST